MLNILWLAIIIAIGIYGSIHVMMSRTPRSSTVSPIFPLLMGLMAIPEWLGAWWWHGSTLRAISERAGPTRLQQLGLEERAALQTRLQNATIVCLALFDAPAVQGLANSLAGSPSPQLFWWLAGVSLLFLLFFRLQGYPAIFDLFEKLEIREFGVHSS